MDEFRKLEELALEAAVTAGETVRIFLINGYQAAAVILDFDDSCVLAKVNGKKWLIYRHAISTIVLD